MSVVYKEVDLGEVKGESGKSAYQIWLDQGHEGTESDFFEFLKGEKGEKGDKGDQGIQGIQGIQGEQGIQGVQGEQGATGARILSTVLDRKDENGGNVYQQTFDDGSKAEFTAPKGDKGDSGLVVTQGQPTFVVEEGELYVYVPQNSANPYEVGEDGNLYMTIAKITRMGA